MDLRTPRRTQVASQFPLNGTFSYDKEYHLW